MFGRKPKKVEFRGKTTFSIDEYLEIEAQLTETYEFHNEFVEKLNEPDFLIGSTLKFEKTLSNELAGRNLKVFSNFLSKKKKIWIKSENSLMYPSLFVVEGDINYCFGRQDIIDNPLLVIEVSTIYSMGHINSKRGDQKYLGDRTSRFRTYQKIPSLKEYVIIADVGQILFETYNRLEDNAWKYRVYSEREKDEAYFESLNLKLPVKKFFYE